MSTWTSSVGDEVAVARKGAAPRFARVAAVDGQLVQLDDGTVLEVDGEGDFVGGRLLRVTAEHHAKVARFERAVVTAAQMAA